MCICVDFFRLQAPKKTTAKKESKEKRESNEESKENLKAKSDDSGEEKNGDDDSQKNGPKKKGEYDKTFSMSAEETANMAFSLTSCKDL